MEGFKNLVVGLVIVGLLAGFVVLGFVYPVYMKVAILVGVLVGIAFVLGNIFGPQIRRRIREIGRKWSESDDQKYKKS